MPARVVWTPYGRPALDALKETVAQLKQDQPLHPDTATPGHPRLRGATIRGQRQMQQGRILRSSRSTSNSTSPADFTGAEVAASWPLPLGTVGRSVRRVSATRVTQPRNRQLLEAGVAELRLPVD